VEKNTFVSKQDSFLHRAWVSSKISSLGSRSPQEVLYLCISVYAAYVSSFFLPSSYQSCSGHLDRSMTDSEQYPGSRNALGLQAMTRVHARMSASAQGWWAYECAKCPAEGGSRGRDLHRGKPMSSTFLMHETSSWKDRASLRRPAKPLVDHPTAPSIRHTSGKLPTIAAKLNGHESRSR